MRLGGEKGFWSSFVAVFDFILVYSEWWFGYARKKVRPVLGGMGDGDAFFVCVLGAGWWRGEPRLGRMRFPGGWFVVVRLVAVGIMWGCVWGVVVGVDGKC